MRSNLIKAAGGILTVMALAALPPAVSARGGGGGGHGGDGGHGGGHGGHHGGGHHGGHYGGRRGGYHYGGRSYASRGSMYGHSMARSTPSYSRSYSSINRSPGYAMRNGSYRSFSYNSGSPNGYYRYRYPYNNSYFFGYNSPFGMLGYGGYGNGYGGYGNGWPYYYYQPACTWNNPATNTYVSNTNGYPVTQPAAAQLTSPRTADGADATISSFAVQGEANFKAGNYAAAEHDWRHALVDDPNNGALVMLLAQALFANGKFDEAAGAVQRGMQMVPPDKWGAVVSNYAELYRGNQDYTDQLRRLEAARLATASPALQFLLGYHYGYLGYPKHATAELDKAMKLAPQDQAAQKLRGMMAAK